MIKRITFSLCTNPSSHKLMQTSSSCGKLQSSTNGLRLLAEAVPHYREKFVWNHLLLTTLRGTFRSQRLCSFSQVLLITCPTVTVATRTPPCRSSQQNSEYNPVLEKEWEACVMQQAREPGAEDPGQAESTWTHLLKHTRSLQPLRLKDLYHPPLCWLH